MIRRLQYKFIIYTTLTVSIIITVLLMLLNQIFSRNSLGEVYHVLHYVVEENGKLPKAYNTQLDGYVNQNQIHCFSVVFRGKTIEFHRLNVNISQKKALSLAQKTLKNSKKEGQIKDKDTPYCYLIHKDDSKTIVAFMDCYKEFYDIEKLKDFSTWFGVLCLLVFFVIVSFLSRKAVKPVIRNFENQKRFVTNAGHELKTPIAIISANTEFLEMLHGKNEWTQSTINQVSRLNTLISNLITLSKLGELTDNVFSTIDLSSWLTENIKEFQKIAKKNHIKMESHIEPGLKVVGVAEHIKELINILCDNAIKYCDKDGDVLVELYHKAPINPVTFSISNTYSEGKDINVDKFFERFYRGDQSHNSEIQGYGIGLSMAEGFAEESKAKLSVHYKDDRITFFVRF